MFKNHKFQIILLLLFLLSLSLRLALVGVNRDANDPHVNVARLILQNHSLPIKTDCWECSQPKLFHLAFAIGLKLLGQIVTIPATQQNLVGEVINYFASLITLLFVWKLIRRLPFRQNQLPLIVFALVALNPALIGINSQATNDTFAILFSTLALYYAFDFFQEEKIISFLLIILFLILGISSKTNTWVTMLAILLAFFVKAWVQRSRRRKTIAYAMALIITVIGLSAVNPLNQAIINYRKFGSPIVNNVSPYPLPHWSEPTYDSTPGIVSIRDGFFTFEFMGLLAHPRIETGAKIYPSFRTSFWSLLYGRAYSLHFLNWPPSWSTTSDRLFMLTRGIFILALIPTFFILFGAVIDIALVIKSIIKREDMTAKATNFGLFAFVFIGYLAFITLYALEYRDLYTMNAIFIFPAILAFPLFLLRSGDKVYRFLEKRNPWFVRILEIAIGMLLVLSIGDVAALILELARPYLQSHGVPMPRVF